MAHLILPTRILSGRIERKGRSFGLNRSVRKNEPLPIRAEFPPAGSEYLGGESDGFVYRTVFAGASLAHSFEMVRLFLQEEGYADVPLPANVEELTCFRIQTRNKQILMFDDNGYIHNPVKILFHKDRRKHKVLILEIYNEASPQHLLRFHRKL